MALKKTSTKKGNNRLRIIGGDWRGRRVEFAAVEGLRPTGDRIRETLFNWLMAVVPGAHCLDLFAGSGALSFEALSRGAESATLIDQSKLVTNELRTQLQILKCENATVINGNSIRWLEKQRSTSKQFDLIFLDPPFHKGLLNQSLSLLEDNELLKPDAMIYIESESNLSSLDIPINWTLHREKNSGQVTCSLYQREAESPTRN